MNYCRVLHPDDYKTFDEHKLVVPLRNELSIYRYEHHHRNWEYGLALKLLLNSDVKTVLEVGGGGSLLAPLLAINDFDVTVVDPDPWCGEAIKNQRNIINKSIKFIGKSFLDYDVEKTFDAVLCISVIEHVILEEEVKLFWNKLLESSDDLVFITTDFRSDGVRGANQFHMFTKEKLQDLLEIAKKHGFFSLGEPDWEYKGNFVYDYTFASMGLKRNARQISFL